MKTLQKAVRANLLSLSFTVITYGTVLSAVGGLAIFQALRETSAEKLSGPRILRVVPGAVPPEVFERVEILADGTPFSPETTVTSPEPGLVVSEVRLLELDRLEATLLLSEGLARRRFSEEEEVRLVISTPLREGGRRELEERILVSRWYRPVGLDLVSFKGLDVVEVPHPFVVLGYRPEGYAPFHLAVHNRTSGETFTQETWADLEHRGIVPRPEIPA